MKSPSMILMEILLNNNNNNNIILYTNNNNNDSLSRIRACRISVTRRDTMHCIDRYMRHHKHKR